jgi:hypothetical protein
MNYNKPYIDLRYALINSFLINAKVNLLDLSYSIDGNLITIQIGYLDGTACEFDEMINKFKSYVNDFEVMTVFLAISKNDFNAEAVEEFTIYKRLESAFFVKSELL